MAKKYIEVTEFGAAAPDNNDRGSNSAPVVKKLSKEGQERLKKQKEQQASTLIQELKEAYNYIRNILLEEEIIADKSEFNASCCLTIQGLALGFDKGVVNSGIKLTPETVQYSGHAIKEAVIMNEWYIRKKLKESSYRDARQAVAHICSIIHKDLEYAAWRVDKKEKNARVASDIYNLNSDENKEIAQRKRESELRIEAMKKQEEMTKEFEKDLFGDEPTEEDIRREENRKRIKQELIDRLW